MSEVILSLGSNLGDRTNAICEMMRMLGETIVEPIRYSRTMETGPVGVETPQNDFLNLIVRAQYEGTPRCLLESCKTIETRLGRERPFVFAPRTADIDILLFGDVVVNDEDLEVPHPRMLDRRFCLEGLAQVAPEMVHPVLGKSFAVLHKQMPDRLRNQRVNFVD